MASLARSFKPPSYLHPYRRPGMPGRTLSNSSELSLTSNASGRSDDIGDLASSRPSTPSHPPTSAEERAPSAKGMNINTNPDAAAAANSPRLSFSRPIAIELPKMRKINSAPVYTPPEPLSARGDLPGGYFPMHEDPRTRVHRPHPFHHRATDTSNMNSDHNKTSHPTVGSFISHGSHMPVASYISPGFHENPVPMGKYYPSNYEKRNSGQKSLQPPSLTKMPSSVKSDTQVPKYRPSSSNSTASEDETRRKIQQYQRDMIMQAALALGNTTANASQLAAGVSLNGGVEIRLASAAPTRPISPRLVPLGSPGPVTPMELESSGGSYLDKGHGSEMALRLQ
ncbi:hypothetical protein PT974_01430 [Cladobotryum mycophilum]|uniref:Uncharacterized protein n=1 Tax=Cladobotryum mycophilum TaxID=491253 RepID=A0ABR0T3P0_9HYPO